MVVSLLQTTILGLRMCFQILVAQTMGDFLYTPMSLALILRQFMCCIFSQTVFLFRQVLSCQPL